MSLGFKIPLGNTKHCLILGALNCHSNDDRRAWFAIDLGVWIIPTAYSLRHARGYGRSALRTWQLQGSRDGLNWTVLSDHIGDEKLGEPGTYLSNFLKIVIHLRPSCTHNCMYLYNMIASVNTTKKV